MNRFFPTSGLRLLVISIWATTLVLPISSKAFAGKKKKTPDPYYQESPLFLPAPDSRKPWKIKNFGPIGLGLTLRPPSFTTVIDNVEGGSPAAKTGKLKKGQIIESINGKRFSKIDPRIILGDIVTEAEAGDGKVVLKIKGGEEVTVQLPILGAYSKTWPLNCNKSDAIIRKLADHLAKRGKGMWGSVIFLLSTGEDKDLEVVKKWMKEGAVVGGYQWDKGYRGLGICEYYLRTGDETVLPAIEKGCEELEKYMYNGGWSGRTHSAAFTYSTGTGQMNAAGVHCVTYLLMAKMCGVKVDEYTLQQSLKQFYRYAGHANVPYGDGAPEGGYRDNGKTGGLAVAMSAAALLTPGGETSVYAKARDVSAMKSFYATNWFHAAHTGGGIGEIWHHKAMGLMHEKRPTQYRSYMDTRRWVMELSRRHNGAIGIAGMLDDYDHAAGEEGMKAGNQRPWGTHFALTYTLPRKKLILFGAPKTKWCKSYELPLRPWGNAADDSFVSPEPAPNGKLTMSELLEERVETDSSARISARMNKGKEEELFKLLHHPEYGMRNMAIGKIVGKKLTDLVLQAMKSKDPRVRHAGVMAISGGIFKGGFIEAEDITPEMFELISTMVLDPNESWWVVREAVTALPKGGAELVLKHKDRLLELLDHDDWFLSLPALKALNLIATRKGQYKTILPKVIHKQASYTSAQALLPVYEFSKILAKASDEIKAFAEPILKDAYSGIPSELTAPGGEVMSGGGKYVRSCIARLMEHTPGGIDFIKKLPRKTLSYIRSGDDKDKYVYDGKFVQDPKLVGEWGWVLYPTPKNEREIDGRIQTYMNHARKPSKGKKIFKPKGVLNILNDGTIGKGNYYTKSFWSGNMIVAMGEDQAVIMEMRTVDGVDFLIVERGGFDEAQPGEKKDWHCGYLGFIRYHHGQKLFGGTKQNGNKEKEKKKGKKKGKKK